MGTTVPVLRKWGVQMGNKEKAEISLTQGSVGCVILCKFLHLSDPHFPSLWNGVVVRPPCQLGSCLVNGSLKGEAKVMRECQQEISQILGGAAFELSLGGE